MKKPRIWIFVVDSRNRQDVRDLDHFDGIVWGSNPNARKGDIILMYRTTPFKDLAYIFTATSNPRLDKEDEADMDYVIDLGNKIRLGKPIGFDELKNSRVLAKWSFARNTQGIMRRKKDIDEEGYWGPLRRLLLKKNPSVAVPLARLEGKSRGRTEGSLTSWESFVGPKSSIKPQLRVFMSYTHADLRRVRRLFRKLRSERGLNLWFDKESLLPSDNWEEEIERAIRMSDIVIVCLSSNSLRRRGFAQKEINWALQKADEQPESTTWILPVKLEKCSIPNRLARAQFAELFLPDGYFKLRAGLRKRATLLNQSGTT